MSTERLCAPSVRTLFAAKALSHDDTKRPEGVSLLPASRSSAGRFEP
jgi:hypothetical protein